MSRLLLLLLLYQAGFTVGKYVSLEKAIENSKAGYYETLRESSVSWQEGTNDYRPYVEYLLGIIVGAYRELDERLAAASQGRGSQSARVEAQVRRSLGTFCKRDLQDALPDVSVITIERTLRRLLDAGAIEKVGAGRGTKYVARR